MDAAVHSCFYPDDVSIAKTKTKVPDTWIIQLSYKMLTFSPLVIFTSFTGGVADTTGDDDIPSKLPFLDQ